MSDEVNVLIWLKVICAKPGCVSFIIVAVFNLMEFWFPFGVIGEVGALACFLGATVEAWVCKARIGTDPTVIVFQFHVSFLFAYLSIMTSFVVVCL